MCTDTLNPIEKACPAAKSYNCGKLKMMQWIETLGMLLISTLGISLGAWAAAHSQRACRCALAVAFSLLGVVLLARFKSLWADMPFLCPVAVGRMRFVFLVLTITIGLTSTVNHFRGRFCRASVCAMMVAMVSVLIACPFLIPALAQKDLALSKTTIDSDGICRQSRQYTCGPAAAVTALKKLGFEVEEGFLAMKARTAPFIGTSPWELQTAINREYGGAGVVCRLSYLDSLESIPEESVFLAIIAVDSIIDHCVVVINYTNSVVTLADPAEGLIAMNRQDFMDQWRKYGMVLSFKNEIQNAGNQIAKTTD